MKDSNKSRLQIKETVTRLVVRNENSNDRLDVFAAAQLESGISRSQIQAFIKQGRVMLNGMVVTKPSIRVKTNDVVEVAIPHPEKWDLEAEDISLDIIYENNNVLVVNKPRGMVVHPAAGHKRGTLVNAILSYCPEIAGVGDNMRPGIVHRLDKDTTGVLVVAKNETTLRQLQTQMKNRKAKREYVVLCKGRIGKDQGIVDAPIGRHPVDRKRMAVITTEPGISPRTRAREAVTQWQVVTRFDSAYTLIIARLLTGRTHQIRVHMSYIGHPVAGDRVYGRTGRKLKLSGQALHAFRLGLFLGENYDEYQEFTAPLPADFAQVLLSLKNKHREELPSWLMI